MWCLFICIGVVVGLVLGAIIAAFAIYWATARVMMSHLW